MDDEVLGAAVGHDADLRAVGERLPGFREDRPRTLRAEARLQRPREDPPRVVVDDRVEVSPGSIEQSDDGHVDMPPLVRSGGADSGLRLRRVDAASRTTPPVVADQAAPCAVGGEDLPEALSKEGQRSQREMLVLLGLDHVADRDALVSGEATGDGPRARRSIFEAADAELALGPFASAGRRQAEDAQCGSSTDGPLCPRHSAQDAPLRGRRRQPGLTERDPRLADQRHEQADDRGEDRDLLPELRDRRMELDDLAYRGRRA